jgi:glycosyltransferase involved in cell wall biosynthesis
MSDPELNVLLFGGRFEVRGSSAYTLRLAENLMDYGIVTRVVCPDAGCVEPGKRDRLSITEYTHMSFPLWGRVVMESVRRDLSKNAPNLIHIQSRNVLAQGTWLARRFRCPMVLTVHDYLSPRERLRFDSTYGQRMIAVSQSVKSEILNRTNLPEDMITVIHSGVEAPDEVDTLPVLDPGHAPVVGTAGPLEAVKGLHFFLGAAQKVLAVRQDVEFLVSGAGPEEFNLRRLARDLGIADHVTFIPNLLDFSTSLAAMDLFCLPSLRQGLGTIMLEAMALGKPVIATAVGGVYSVVRHNQTGLVVPPSNNAQLAQRILELLNDPVQARAIGEAARRMVQKEFGVERMVRQTADLYHEVLAETNVTAKAQ